MMAVLWELAQPFLAPIGIALTALLALWGKAKLDKRKGRIEERTEAKQKDMENAQDIRDRVATDRPERLQSVKDRGYRD
jgi:cytidylate kinase